MTAFIQSTGCADFLKPAHNDRRWFAMPLHHYRVRVPGVGSYPGLFTGPEQAQQDAERRFPDAPPATAIQTGPAT